MPHQVRSRNFVPTAFSASWRTILDAIPCNYTIKDGLLEHQAIWDIEVTTKMLLEADFRNSRLHEATWSLFWRRWQGIGRALRISSLRISWCARHRMKSWKKPQLASAKNEHHQTPLWGIVFDCFGISGMFAIGTIFLRIICCTSGAIERWSTMAGASFLADCNIQSEPTFLHTHARSMCVYILVGGLEHVLSIHWECHHPNWLSLHHFSERWLKHQPVSASVLLRSSRKVPSGND